MEVDKDFEIDIIKDEEGNPQGFMMIVGVCTSDAASGEYLDLAFMFI